MNTFGDRWGSTESGLVGALRNLVRSENAPLADYAETAERTYSLPYTNSLRFAVGSLESLTDAERALWVNRAERVERGLSPVPEDLRAPVPWGIIAAVSALLLWSMR